MIMNTKNLAPVVLFTYKRLPILKRSIESLLLNKECSLTDLIVYSDGPKTKSDEEGVNSVRVYLKKLKGFKSITFIFRDKNLGLAESFIQGITETFVTHEKAIFLEDDNFVSKHFLSFMNDALNHYKNNEKVICISGYSMPIKPEQKEPYFVRGAETWSMGTWRRGWKYFCADAKKLASDIEARGLSKKFDEDGFGFGQTLQNQIRGKVDSWGVRWQASAFLNGLYCLYPHIPLCISIGFGVDSVHCSEYSPSFRKPEDLSIYPITDFPNEVFQKKEVIVAIQRMRGVRPYQKVLNGIKCIPSRFLRKITFISKKYL